MDGRQVRSTACAQVVEKCYIPGKPSPLGRLASVGKTFKPAVGLRRKPILRVVPKQDDASRDLTGV